MGSRPDPGCDYNAWYPWASEQIYEGRHYYRAQVKMWSRDEEHCVEASLPFEYPSYNQAIAGARRLITFLMAEETHARYQDAPVVTGLQFTARDSVFVN